MRCFGRGITSALTVGAMPFHSRIRPWAQRRPSDEFPEATHAALPGRSRRVRREAGILAGACRLPVSDAHGAKSLSSWRASVLVPDTESLRSTHTDTRAFSGFCH